MSKTKVTGVNNLDWTDVLEHIYDSRIDTVGLNERVASLATRSIKNESKLEALNLIVSMCDLTTLEGEDTEGKIAQMSAKAVKPDPTDQSIPSVAAVCVYPSLVSSAKEKVKNSKVKVAAVSSYFPSGQVPMESKLLDTKYAIDQGADEIDIVINRKAFLEGDYRKVFDEIVALKELCGNVHLKTILEVGDLKTYENIRKASIISLAAGSDFIKTSTGKLAIGSSRQACYVMSKAVLDFQSMTSVQAGIKVAGGIRDAKDAIRYLVLVNEEMGKEWLNPDLFRFGASSLLDDVLKQIRKLKTGAYQASYYFPRG